MIASAETAGGERKTALPKMTQYTGEVVYLYAYDVAYEMGRPPVRELLGQPVAQFVMDYSRYLKQRRARALRSCLLHADNLFDFWQPAWLEHNWHADMTQTAA